MGNLLFYLVSPTLFFGELLLIGAGSPHLTLIVFCITLICGKMAPFRAFYAAIFATAAALVHGALVTNVLAGLLVSIVGWAFFQQTLMRNWLTQSLVILFLVISILLLGGDFSWTAPFLIANIIIVPVMVWLWCGV